MPNLVTFHVSRTPIVEWDVVKCGSKNGCQKDTCSKEVGLCLFKIVRIVLSSIVNSIGDTV